MDYKNIIKNKIIPHYSNHIKVLPLLTKIKDKLVDLCLNNDITEAEFYKVTFLLTPQSRSPLWEKYFIKKHHCTRNQKNQNAGDFNMAGVNYEFKVSANLNNTVNIVQIRTWQKCDYIIQAILIEKEEVFTFKLRHSDMIKEMKILKASVAHGTQSANKNNQNIEYRMSLHIDSTEWHYWVKNYSFNF